MQIWLLTRIENKLFIAQTFFFLTISSVEQNDKKKG